jgi:hypothetical protein
VAARSPTGYARAVLWKDMDQDYGRLELPGGLCLEAEWDPERGQWMMWLEIEGIEVADDPYRVLGGSEAAN